MHSRAYHLQLITCCKVSPWVVLKFGGTSVSSRKSWDTIARIIRARRAGGERVCVVCSAASGTSHCWDQPHIDRSRTSERRHSRRSFEYLTPSWPKRPCKANLVRQRVSHQTGPWARWMILRTYHLKQQRPGPFRHDPIVLLYARN